MASDPTAAQTFYPQLTGYSTKSWEGGSTPYTMWMNGDTAVGGPIQSPDEAKQQGAPPHWLAYIATADVDATAAAVLGHGGPWGVGEVSWYELATSDPGAAFDLFGWVKTDTMDMGAAGPYQMFGRTNERSVGGIFARSPRCLDRRPGYST